ncbi:hypothetical protein KQI86_00905 [Clostridium sp. MSJ-11]|uniref:Uncharacterized protein n=1 Tax=Clostridium mobile TaxID=2841512 RepID=A0ABS6ECL7_9CLOT|nr:hypothetical protein [Clostridium mobile]MBU5482862.1 hypothetical protein [Clostridium mobile]
MDPYMMNMCEMCMHKVYCPTMMRMQSMNMYQMPMGMEQMPMMQYMDMDMDMEDTMEMMNDTDIMGDMGLMNHVGMNDGIMDYMRTEYTSNEADEVNEDVAANADFITDENDDLEFARKHKDHWKHCKCDCDEVLEKIERKNPEIFRSLMMCGVPYCHAKKIVSRIIYLTIKYCRD